MKKIYFTLLFSTICLFLYGQTSFNIAGTTRLEFEGRPILLLFMDMEENGVVRIESSIVRDGKFQFKGEINTLDLLGRKYISDLFIVALDNYSRSEGAEYYTEAFLEEGNILIKLDTISHISGTPKNDMLQTYSEIGRKPFSKLHVDFIKDNIDNFLGIMAFRDYHQVFSDNDVNEILVVAGEDFKSNEDVNMCIDSREILKSIKEEGNKREQITGAKCPDFEMITSEGKKVKLYDYIGKSKYVVLDFWASWCGPCIASMPHLKTLSEKYKEKGVEIIGISLDTEDYKQAWLNAVKRINVPWVQLSDLKGQDSELGKAFAISDVPYTVIVDTQGVILDCIRFPVKYLESALDRLP